MPRSLEETVMFANEDEGFEELCGGLLAYISTKQSIQMNENKKSTKKDDPMDVDALDKGAGKGKSKGKDKKNRGKGKGKPINAKTSNWQMCWTEKGDEQADGWIWKGVEQAGGWWKENDWWKANHWQTGTGSGWWTTANSCTPWEP